MEKDKLRDLKQELTDWVTAYKDAAERNALAENPDESAEYLISLIEPLIEEVKTRMKAEFTDLVDQMLKLHKREIEEAKKQSAELILEMRREYEAKLTLKEKIVTERVERQERERIIKWGNEHDPCATNVVKSKRECFTCWQALYEEIK